MLEMSGRKLKTNSVALDIVNFGEGDEGKIEKLGALLTAVNNCDIPTTLFMFQVVQMLFLMYL